MADIAKTSHEACALCGQPARLDSFVLDTPNGQEKFCCAGCLSIYRLLNHFNGKSNPSSKPEEQQP